MVKVTVLVDQSVSLTFQLVVMKKLNFFFQKLVSHLRVPCKKVHFRFGAFGAQACCLVRCVNKPPFTHELKELSVSPHEEVTEQSKEDILTVLQGQPFPGLGYTDVRHILKKASEGPNAADHVILLASWPVTEDLVNTWHIMQSITSVTLVNLEATKPEGCRRPSLCSTWWVDDVEETTIRMARKLFYCDKGFNKTPFNKTPFNKAPFGKNLVKEATLFEKVHLLHLVSILRALPPLRPLQGQDLQPLQGQDLQPLQEQEQE
jgi:hypothetical protein